jgi:hypothetical protein
MSQLIVLHVLGSKRWTGDGQLLLLLYNLFKCLLNHGRYRLVCTLVRIGSNVKLMFSDFSWIVFLIGQSRFCTEQMF